MKIRPGDKVRHRRRDQYGVYSSDVAGDPDSAMVTFEGDDVPTKVSRDQLAKVMG